MINKYLKENELKTIVKKALVENERLGNDDDNFKK
jgi:hypothetical protein